MENNPDKGKDKKFEKLIVKYLHPNERIALEMIVLDSDKKRVAEFLSGFDLRIEDSKALFYCRRWLKIIERGEQGNAITFPNIEDVKKIYKEEKIWSKVKKKLKEEGKLETSE